MSQIAGVFYLVFLLCITSVHSAAIIRPENTHEQMIRTTLSSRFLTLDGSDVAVHETQNSAGIISYRVMKLAYYAIIAMQITSSLK